MNILQIGLNYKTAPVEVREKLSFSAPMLRSGLTHFDATHAHAHLEAVREGVILSTCNRLEVYALVRDFKVAAAAIIKFLARSCEVSPELFIPYLYILKNEHAVRHLMRVASGLDSLVLGEPQILGQITSAYEAALSQRATGTVMSGLFRAAIHTGKRARTETAISVNPSSISSVAAGLAVKLLGDLSARQVLLIGAGEMGAIAVRALQKRGVTNITVANRTFRNAQQLAKAWGGKAISFQQLPDALVTADIVITSTGAPHTILNRNLLEPAMTARPNHPLFLIDIAVPRDIDPDVVEIANVHLQDIDDLQSMADDNINERESEIPQVESIVTQELDNFMTWLLSLSAVSTITSLRQQMNQLREDELCQLFNRINLTAEEEKLIAKMSQRLINKILHEPTIRLKKEAGHGNGAAYTSAMRYLFDLEVSKS